MSQFKNLTVKVSLNDGNTIQGIVKDVEQGQLLLSQVTFLDTGTKIGVFSVRGDQVRDLVVQNAKSDKESKDSENVNTPPTASISNSQFPSTEQLSYHNNIPVNNSETPVIQHPVPTYIHPSNLFLPTPTPPQNYFPDSSSISPQPQIQQQQPSSQPTEIFHDPAILSAIPLNQTSQTASQNGPKLANYPPILPPQPQQYVEQPGLSQPQLEDDSNDSDDSIDPNPYTADVNLEEEEKAQHQHKFYLNNRNYPSNDSSFNPYNGTYYNDVSDSNFETDSMAPHSSRTLHKKPTNSMYRNNYYHSADSSIKGKAKERSSSKSKRKSKKKALPGSLKNDGHYADLHHPVSGRHSSKSTKGNGKHYHSRVDSHNGFESDGWATEDVAYFKDTEFDFQANLDRFNKESVFDELRQKDQVSPGDRLVAHNKIKPPAIAKYGNREMVIQHDEKSRWQDFSQEEEEEEQSRNEEEDEEEEEEDDDDDDDEDDEDDDYDEDDSSIISSFSALFTSSPPSPPSVRRPARTQIQFVDTNSGKVVPCASPVQMVELERLTSETFGISESILTENAGRGVARLSLQSLGGISRFCYGNHNSRPLVVVFAGNTRAGARALAAARHLANRQVRIVALVIGCEDDQTQQRPVADQINPQVKAQIKALKSCRGKVVKRYEQMISDINLIDSPPELIIDGLQGYQTTLDDLWEDDITTVISSIEWANRQKAGIVSLDIPSGIDSATGMPNAHNTKWPHMKSRWVLSCGLPLTGIQNAYLTGTVSKGDWSHYVVDVGFPRSALQKGPLRRFGQIWFGAEWLQQLEVVQK